MDDLLGDILKAIGELFLEYLVKKPGYVIQRYIFRNPNPHPDGFTVLLTGILFWVLVGLSIWGLMVLL